MRLVKGGEVVLSEAPLLLYVCDESKGSACAHCLRAVTPSQELLCPGCGQACFCSAQCGQAGTSTAHVHSADVCRAYACIPSLGLDAEASNQLRFLVHALCLRRLAAAGADPEQRYAQIMVLQEGPPVLSEPGAPERMHAALAAVLGPAALADVAPAELEALLRREQANSYGVMAAPGPDGERRIRGSGIYARASLINHECAPNVARFDAFDSGRPDSTALHFRALHDLPAGTEVVQCYCPLNWSYEERQEHCNDVYGFACNCPRCQTEAQYSDDDSDWETDDEAMEEGSDGLDAADEHSAGAAAAGGASGAGTSAAASGGAGGAASGQENGPLEPTYLHLFLLKYMCPREGCFGTLAPRSPGTDVHECNTCGAVRTEAQFLAELED